MKISLEKKSIGDITVPERKITKLLSLLKQVVQLGKYGLKQENTSIHPSMKLDISKHRSVLDG